jgi:hypothetical protein
MQPNNVLCPVTFFNKQLHGKVHLERLEVPELVKKFPRISWNSKGSLPLSFPFVRMKQGYSHRKNGHEISYLRFSPKFVSTFWFWLKSDKNKGHALRRNAQVHDISPLSVFIFETGCVFCDVSWGRRNSWRCKYNTRMWSITNRPFYENSKFTIYRLWLILNVLVRYGDILQCVCRVKCGKTRVKYSLFHWFSWNYSRI